MPRMSRARSSRDLELERLQRLAARYAKKARVRMPRVRWMGARFGNAACRPSSSTLAHLHEEPEAGKRAGDVCVNRRRYYFDVVSGDDTPQALMAHEVAHYKRLRYRSVPPAGDGHDELYYAVLSKLNGRRRVRPRIRPGEIPWRDLHAQARAVRLLRVRI